MCFAVVVYFSLSKFIVAATTVTVEYRPLATIGRETVLLIEQLNPVSFASENPIHQLKFEFSSTCASNVSVSMTL